MATRERYSWDSWNSVNGNAFEVVLRSSTPLLVLLVAAAAPQRVHAQSLAERVAQAPAGQSVAFSFAAKPGVCGDGHNIINVGNESPRYVDLANGRRAIITSHGRQTIRGQTCEFGPVRIEVRRDGRAIDDLKTRVGGSNAPGTLDLGTVSPAAATAFLLDDVARSASSDAATDAIFAATLGEGVDPWPQLLGIARDEGLAGKVRKSAVFWVGQAASERATEGLRGFIDDASGDVEVRESAVFALSQRPNDEAVPALIAIAKTSPEPELRKSAFFWLGQSNDPRALDLFEEILVRR